MKREKLSDQIAKKIKEMIDNQEYDSNGFLLTEGELASKYEVSRGTVREAVKIMEVRGLVKRIQGKGIQVADNTMQVLTRALGDVITQGNDYLDELLQVRTFIEPKGVELVAQNKNEEIISELKKYVKIMENSVVMDDRYVEADLDFHLCLAKATGNRIHYSIIEAYTPLLRKLIVATSTCEIPIEKYEHYHQKVVDAIEKGDAKQASAAMLIHLNATKQNKMR